MSFRDGCSRCRARPQFEIVSEVCRSSLPEYPRLNEQFLNAYPVGASAQQLIVQLRKTATVVIDGQPFFDPRDGSLARAAPGSIDWNSVKRDSKGYTFQITCIATRDNARYWFVKLLSDRNGLLSARELRPSLDGEANFSARNIPFSFDYFGARDGMQQALRKLLPVGTPRAVAINTLNSIPTGYFGGFVEKGRSVAGGGLIYVYQANPVADLKARLIVDAEPGFIVNLSFDASQRLVQLSVQ